MADAPKMNKVWTDAFLNSTSAALGATASVLVGQSLDTTKVKMQTFPTLYRNFVHCFIHTFKTQGIKGLYRGTVPSLLANAGENAVVFLSFGLAERFLVNYNNLENSSKLSIPQLCLAGAFGGFCGAFVLCPTELIKCKLQTLSETHSKTKISPFSVASDIIRNNGFRGLFKGLEPTMLREVPGYFAFFGAYKYTISFFESINSDKENYSAGSFELIMAGGIAGTSLWLCIFPFDTIKSKVQVINKSFAHSVAQILQESGIRGFYKGLAPTLIRTFPSTGVLFYTYETSKSVGQSLIDYSYN